MLAYRICRKAFSRLDGEGARLYGGRWNSSGRAAVYASSTLSLAAVEYLVHVDAGDAPSDLVALTIDIPDDVAIETIDPSRLAAGWERSIDHEESRSLGDRWLDTGSTAVLRVPSAAIPRETNVLLNPRHADFINIRISNTEPFTFDPRLLR